jgi:Chaperone of endosialidase
MYLLAPVSLHPSAGRVVRCAVARLVLPLMALALHGLALGPRAFGVSPPPDGGYPNGNTAEGEDALLSLTIGIDNTAVGFNALVSNTKGDDNTAVGFDALFSNTIGRSNTAIGVNALLFNGKGEENTAVGVNAMISNTAGGGNTAIGVNALVRNKTGGANVAIGIDSLSGNTTGDNNVASGNHALSANTAGFFNVATGVDALTQNTTGNNNIAMGPFAGIAITTGNNNIDIGNDGVTGDSGAIRIGTKGTQSNTFLAGIRGVTVAGGVAVVVGADGHLGTLSSSERFKRKIKPMEQASEAVLQLKPVTFRYMEELDPAAIPQFGLVAEQVEKVNPDLVARDEEGKPYAVRYEAVNAMLLNEFLKEHRKVEAQQLTIQELTSAVAHQQKQIQTLSENLREISNRMEQH